MTRIDLPFRECVCAHVQEAAAVLVTACSVSDLFGRAELERDWNAEWSALAEQSHFTPTETADREQQLSKLQNEFHDFAVRAALRIIDERCLPSCSPQRLVRSLTDESSSEEGMRDIDVDAAAAATSSGPATGSCPSSYQFVVGNVFFQFTHDYEGLFDGDDECAQKVAMNEVRAASALTALNGDINAHASVPFLLTSLCAAVRFCGHCILATAFAPINQSSLVYGSNDGGEHFHNDSSLFEVGVSRVAERLNLAKHLVCSEQPQSVRPAESFVGFDVEGHRSYVDGKF